MSSRPDDRTRESEGNHTERDADRLLRSRDQMRAVVVYGQNAYGAITLRDGDTNATYQVVEYAAPDLQATAGRLNPGATVEVDLMRVGCRANAWRAQALSVVDSGRETTPSPADG